MFEQTLSVQRRHLDGQAHVNNVVYLQWIEEIAVAHWVALTSPEIRAETAWVLLRHEIDYLRPGTLGEVLILRTIVPGMEGVRVERRTAVYRAGDGMPLVRSRSLWVPVDPRTGRPRRVTDHLRTLFLEPGAELPDRMEAAPAR